MLKTVLLLDISENLDSFFLRIFGWIENLKEPHLFQIAIFGTT